VPDTTDKPAWLDLSCGVSGDMLLGALLGAGVPLSVLRDAVGSLGLPVSLQQNATRRGGLAATWVVVQVSEPQPAHRPWAVVRELLAKADLAEPVRECALAAFRALAEAEGAVHGVMPESVVFHEVGAHDAVADVVGTCAGLHWLREQGLLTSLHATPIALGGGTVQTAHGELPIPAPAVLGLLSGRGVPSHGGPVDVELATPTGVALAVTLVDTWGPLPEMAVGAVGIGAGSREVSGRPNVVRLVLPGT
jgi:uncharacterized protein (TIGR00299 family) protein